MAKTGSVLTTMLRQRSNTFYCFSPPVMIATAVIELSLLVFTFLRYKRTTVFKLVMAMLFFLAAFQIAEYNVCGGMGLNSQTWSRFGFMVIATLPALGLHTILSIAKKDLFWLKNLAYGTAAFWVALFGLSNDAFSGYQCGGNYIIFQLNHAYGSWYGIHYYLWLFVGIGVALWLSRTADKLTQQILQLFVVGYGAFIIPTAVVNTLSPHTTEGLPSILCGFAVFFALLLGLKIAPLIEKQQRLTQKHKQS